MEKELAASPSCFFILTNSRALPTDQAAQLTRAICRNVAAAAESAGKRFTIVLRGDSTLRGHFPQVVRLRGGQGGGFWRGLTGRHVARADWLQEAEAAAEVVGGTDAWLLCPFFLQGGRYTIGDVHYVAEGDRWVGGGMCESCEVLVSNACPASGCRLVPAGQTEFAKDDAFGYKSSNLKEVGVGWDAYGNELWYMGATSAMSEGKNRAPQL